MQIKIGKVVKIGADFESPMKNEANSEKFCRLRDNKERIYLIVYLGLLVGLFTWYLVGRLYLSEKLRKIAEKGIEDAVSSCEHINRSIFLAIGDIRAENSILVDFVVHYSRLDAINAALKFREEIDKLSKNIEEAPESVKLNLTSPWTQIDFQRRFNATSSASLTCAIVKGRNDKMAEIIKRIRAYFVLVNEQIKTISEIGELSFSNKIAEENISAYEDHKEKIRNLLFDRENFLPTILSRTTMADQNKFWGNFFKEDQNGQKYGSEMEKGVLRSKFFKELMENATVAIKKMEFDIRMPIAYCKDEMQFEKNI